jgi:hypothetical protein
VGQLFGQVETTPPEITPEAPQEPVTTPPVLIGRYSHPAQDLKAVAERVIFGQQVQIL